MARSVKTFLDLFEQVLLIGGSERARPRHHHVEEHSKCPHVNRLAIVLDLTRYFRRHVARSAAENLQSRLAIREDHTETKVY